ncbi:uncharacterized protein LOC119731845 isoform X2 [Patiria miniata]|uniref:Uncharacterized protein n=1 Tax=Patiria miniata TaxID=46514 RepID=A0A914AB03_PATMI|nr:uncharacterized protein LOC119731845 isoform X2 [Patiria miniata]
MTKTMTLLFYTVTMAMVVTVLSLRECEQTAGVVQFPYVCLDNRLVNPCFQGRHLRIAQPECVGEVDEDKICDKCTTGFIEGSNFCNECNPWTECGPDEMEDPENPPSAIRDRTCIRNSAPTESSSHSPPSDVTTQPTCPSCPDCPTLDPSITSTVDGAEGPGTSYVPLPDSDISTAPQGGTSTVGPLPRGVDNNDIDAWKGTAISSIILNIIQFIILCVVVWRCCQRKRKRMRKCPKHEGAVKYNKQNGCDIEQGRQAQPPDPILDAVDCHQEPQNNNPDCGAALAGIGSGQPCVLNVDLPPESSEGATTRSPEAAPNLGNPTVTKATPPKSTDQPEGANNISSSSEDAPFADEVSFEDETSPSCGPQEARADNDAAGSRRVSSSPHRRRAPPARDGYSVGGDTPSQQPLLRGNDTIDSEIPTNEFQQSVPATNITNHIGDSAESLQSRPNGTARHEAPTAPYRKSPATSPSYSAFEKAEGPCEMTSICSEWHIDYVKDNINIKTHVDFFAKLGLSKKGYETTMYDNRNEKTREQVRHVLLDDFIQNEHNPSIDRLLSALERSGNNDVSRGFKVKFSVTSSAGS